LILTKEQINLRDSPLDSRIFLSGPAGYGKTTAALSRLDHLLKNKVNPQEILLLVPQKTLAIPYYRFLKSKEYPANGEPVILTIGGMARRMVDLFWPLICEPAGFSPSELSPTFLTLETAQYYLAQATEPLFTKGYFSSINIDHNRLLSQILDNMNKAAVVGFPLEEIGDRLKDACQYDQQQMIAFQQAEECALLFRKFCLEHHLLDYSLQMEIFIKYIWSLSPGRNFIIHQFRHLIYDNVEEDVPVVHDLVKSWIPDLQSVLLIYDTDGGFRSFLGADPTNGYELHSFCDNIQEFKQSFTSSSGLEILQRTLSSNILLTSKTVPSSEVLQEFDFVHSNFYPEMIDSACSTINELINEKSESPTEIVILAPYLSDALLFSLSSKLAEYQINSYSARPSRPLVKEPVVGCLLTLAKLAHPLWDLPISQYEVRQALMVAINEMDLVRADLCSRTLFSERHKQSGLNSFNQLKGELPERITFSIGEKFEKIRDWLEEYKSQEILPLFGFFGKVFGELLSQPGFAFHQDFESASITSRLTTSAKKFRQVMVNGVDFSEVNCGREYMITLQKGLIGAQFYEPEMNNPPESVLISPAFTYLITNRAVKYQFWLDIGSNGWWERLNQPLTHPHILNRHWQRGDKWQDANEIKANQVSLARLVRGLIRRCNKHLFLYTAGIDDQGREQRNQLLQAFQLVYKQLFTQKGSPGV
jgi:hypothetical protein